MPAPPGPGQCIYCLQDVEVRNWDHIMPKAWYPTTSPDNLERWKVPSCIRCNSAHGQNEADLLVRLMMCFGKDDARAAGISRRVIRSMDPREAQDERDRRARLALFRAVGRDMFHAPRGSDGRGVIPNFGPGEPGASDRAIHIPGESLGKLAEKVIRGFTYLQRQAVIAQREIG